MNCGDDIKRLRAKITQLELCLKNRYQTLLISSIDNMATGNLSDPQTNSDSKQGQTPDNVPGLFQMGLGIMSILTLGVLNQ